jgi:Flp pilus assembly protein CpaB
MFKAKTVIVLLISVFMGLLAVKGVSMLKREPVQAAPVIKAVSVQKPEKKIPEQSVYKGRAFSRGIPEGMRIVTIGVDEISGVTRELAKDDRVDILAVSPCKGVSNGKISRIVLQYIKIYALEETSFKKHLTDKAARKKKTWTIHLLVTPEQGAVIASISEATKLRLLLRNANDNEILETMPTIYASDTGVVTVDRSASNPATLIKAGMRAITLQIDNTDGVCGTLKPGDRVDVIFSSKASVFSTQGGNQAVGTKGEIFNVRKSSKILLQDVEVLTTEQLLKNVFDKSKAATCVTLVVTPAQAEKLAVIADSSKEGDLRIVTRNPMDRERITTRGELLSDLFLKDKRAFRIIEVLKGSTTHPIKFYVD